MTFAEYWEENGQANRSPVDVARLAWEADRWLPIATAPKDRKLILTFAIVDTDTGNWNTKISCFNEQPDKYGSTSAMRLNGNAQSLPRKRINPNLPPALKTGIPS